jgi:diketogulonate reductase-like aldo/keto reductase
MAIAKNVRLRVRILVKAFPQPSEKHEETVCCAGITEDRRQLLRLFPIRYRRLPKDHQFERLGISNCYQLEQLETLCDAARILPSAIQNRFYAATHYDREIRVFCKARQIVYQSFWTLTANPQLLAHATVVRLSASYGRSAAQILFRYLSQNDIVPLTGPRSEKHMRKDLEIFDFELDASECQELAALPV